MTKTNKIQTTVCKKTDKHEPCLQWEGRCDRRYPGRIIIPCVTYCTYYITQVSKTTMIQSDFDIHTLGREKRDSGIDS